MPNARQSFELTRPSRLAQFIDYGREGVWHIWIGFDHILFLLSLLLPAVLVPSLRSKGLHAGSIAGWQAVERFSLAFWDVLKIVTALEIE